MIEPEMAFADLNDAMDNAEAYVKHVVGHALEACAEDLAFFGYPKFGDAELLPRLRGVVDKLCGMCGVVGKLCGAGVVMRCRGRVVIDRVRGT